MRDATDNVTGELDVTIRRGRGRPRKEGALTNAQRQAAFRARRRKQGVTVTRNVVERVQAEDVYGEVERLRVELAEALEGIKVWQNITADLRKQLFRAEVERDAVIGWGVSRDEAKLQAALIASGKSVTRKRVTKKGAQ